MDLTNEFIRGHYPFNEKDFSDCYAWFKLKKKNHLYFLCGHEIKESDKKLTIKYS